MKILLDISFLGTAYCGYQVQPNAPTIQGQLNRASKTIFGFDCDGVGCSRTDRGVHASQFFVTISKKGEQGIETNIPIDRLPTVFSVYLPQDISVNSASIVSDSFHARYDVKYKEYIYRIWNGSIRDPFTYDRSWHYPRYIDDDTILKMNKAASHFIGTHDFGAYMAANSNVKNTIRTIYSIDFEVVTKDDRPDILKIKFIGNGFLHNMVRILVAMIFMVGIGKLSKEELKSILAKKNRQFAPKTAPASGLYLYKVYY